MQLESTPLFVSCTMAPPSRPSQEKEIHKPGNAINDAGQIVGNGTTTGAFLYSNGKMVPLGVSSNGSWANAINSTGNMIAG